MSCVRCSGIDARAAGRLERKSSLPDEFPDRRLPAIDAGPDHDPFEPPELPDELIDELLAGARTPEEITGPDGLLQRLTKRLVERAMAAELSEHLGYERGEAPPGGACPCS